jgi:hypothetical protein
MAWSSDSILESAIRGTKTGQDFEDRAPPGGILIGFRIGFDEPGGSISNLRPIYQVANRCTFGAIQGSAGGTPYDVVARPNYAVGGVLVTATSRIHSFQAIFLKICGPGELDPARCYYSSVIGRANGESRRIHGEGRPIVEVFGFSSGPINALGLGAMDSPGVPAERPLAEASPDRPTVRDESAPPESNPPATPPDGTARRDLPDPDSAESKSANQPGDPTTDEKVVAEEFRNWTSSGGNFSVTAKFVSFDGKILRVEDRSGRVFKVELDKLTLADQEYVRGRSPR